MQVYYTVNVVPPKIYTLKLNPHMVAFGGDKSWGVEPHRWEISAPRAPHPSST